MLSKLQKTWTWIFGAMVIVPEVLWGNLIKALRVPFLPIYGNIQIFTSKPALAYLVIIMEIVGTIGLIYLLNREYQNGKLKYFFNAFLGLVLLLLIISLCLSYAISNIQLL